MRDTPIVPQETSPCHWLDDARELLEESEALAAVLHIAALHPDLDVTKADLQGVTRTLWGQLSRALACLRRATE